MFNTTEDTKMNEITPTFKVVRKENTDLSTTK